MTLRILQKLFIDKMVAGIHAIDTADVRKVLVEAIGDDAAEVHLASKRREAALPLKIEDFPAYIRNRFLNYVPVRIFLKPWIKSLDDDQGREDLYTELNSAYEALKAGRSYRMKKGSVFEITQGAGSGEDEG